MKTIFDNINSGETRKTSGAKSSRRAKSAGQKKTMKRAGSARTGEALKEGREGFFRRGEVKSRIKFRK